MTARAPTQATRERRELAARLAQHDARMRTLLPAATPAARDDAAALDAHLAASRARFAARAAQVSDAAYGAELTRLGLGDLARRCSDTMPARARRSA